MRRSFRFRIALLITLVSGAVLVAFNIATWNAVRRSNLSRLDQSIRELGDRYLGAPRGPRYWQRVAESMESVLGDISENPFIMLVRGRDGETLHVSHNWPGELRPDSYPTPLQAGFSDVPPARQPHGFGRGGGGRFGQRNEELAGPPGFGEPPIPPPGPPRHMPVLSGPFHSVQAGGKSWRIGVMSNPEATIVLGLNIAQYRSEMAQFTRLILVAGAGALLLIALGGWWLAQRALRPVLALTQAAETITAQGLDRRICTQGADAEFERLIQVFNGMMDRLETSFRQAVRFSADAAHELKTPLTILQGELAEAVQRAEAGSKEQQRVSRLLEEVQRLKSITRKLLLLSLADSGQLKPHRERVNLSDIVLEAVDDLQILARDIRTDLDVQPAVVVEGDPDLLRQVVQNLASNSVKYNEPGGKVAVQLTAGVETATIVFGNSGPGIAPEDRDRVFERFYRADKSRSRRTDGTGLGLSLAREIVRAHHGELVLKQSEQSWTVFAATLPLTSIGAGETLFG